jgi:hypothetical protein
MSFSQDNQGNVTIKLTGNDYGGLLLCLGYATGAAVKEGDMRLADKFLEMSNIINQGNPKWVPYEIPFQTKTHEVK